MDIRITNSPDTWEIYERERAIIIGVSTTRDEAIEKLIALIKRLEL